MGRKKDLCRNANGLFVRNLGWKRTAAGYVQHKFYLGRDDHMAKVASLRLEQLWDQVCRRWERDYGWQKSNRTGKTFVRPLGLGIGDLDGTAKFAPSPPDVLATGVPQAGVGFCIVRIGDGGPTVGERERPTWDDVTLAIAAALRDGQSVAVVPVPSGEALEGQSIGDWLDGLRRDFPGVEIKLADANAHRQAEQDVEKDAQRLIDLGREKLLRRTGGASLHPALDAYAKWISAKYVTLDGRRTAWGGTQVRQVEFIHRHLPDLPLPELDAPKIESLIDVLRLRPAGADGNRVSVAWTRNCLKQFRHFLKWLNRAPEFGWRRPVDLEFPRVRVPAAHGESPARPAAARVQTYTEEELSRLWEYATPFQRLLLLLGLNCGFGRAEVASLELSEVHLRQPHPYAREVGCAATASASWVLRVRSKSGVYGEWKLWPETTAAIDWWLRQRAAAPAADGVTTLLVNRNGQRYDTPTKGNHTNFQIPNSWLSLIQRIRQDHPAFRKLSFNKLRKTAGNLVRSHGDGELAGVFLCHGTAVPADKLLDVYTNRPFAKLFAVIDRVGETLRPLWAKVTEPFPDVPVRGGPNISRATIHRIREMKRQGFKTGYVARQVGVSEETVRRWARKCDGGTVQ